MRKDTLEMQVMKKIARKRGDVFLREDFADLAGYDQVGRILSKLVRDKKLIKVSQGVYTRVVVSPFSGQVLPVNGLRTLKEALQRLGVETAPTQLDQDYETGRTTQVPTGRVVKVKRRVRRKIGYNDFYLGFERAGSTPR